MDCSFCGGKGHVGGGRHEACVRHLRTHLAAVEKERDEALDKLATDLCVGDERLHAMQVRAEKAEAEVVALKARVELAEFFSTALRRNLDRAREDHDAEAERLKGLVSHLRSEVAAHREAHQETSRDSDRLHAYALRLYRAARPIDADPDDHTQAMWRELAEALEAAPESVKRAAEKDE